jgi:hypothetical protein
MTILIKRGPNHPKHFLNTGNLLGWYFFKKKQAWKTNGWLLASTPFKNMGA